MMRPIAISLSPNTERDDVLLSLKLIFSPWLWFSKKHVYVLEQEFGKMFEESYRAFATNSGRSSLYVILKALGIKKGDEVLLQAFTCVAVPNSILWAGAHPVYVDIDQSYNIDLKDLEKKITKNTKAIIVQHTFGIPAQVQLIKRIAQENNLVFIEDCAHSLGATFAGKKIGTSGDVSFFSFGRDKISSSIFGGMILVRKEIQIQIEIEKVFNRLKWPGVLWGLQQLWHPIAFSIILPLYSSGLGKLILFTFQKLHLLSRAVYEKEKKGKRPDIFPSRMSPALAILARHQLKKLNYFNNHRQKIVKYYFANLPQDTRIILPRKRGGETWLRFPIQVSNQVDLIKFAKKRGVLLGDWYKEVIAPCSDPAIAGYKQGSCPNAERLAKNIINLPTYITLSLNDANKVVQLVKEWLATQQN